jgi:hypothetical protein
MSRWSEREIARKLAERDELEPPAGLLEKIKSEIPPMIPAGTGLPEIDRRPSMPPRQRWLIAASLVAMLGAGLFALRVRMAVSPVEETARTAAGAQRAETPKVSPPPPPTVPPPAAHALAQPEPSPRAQEPKPLSRQDEEKLKSLGYVSPGARGGVEGGVVGGVVGGTPGPMPAAPPAAAPAPVPPPPAEVQAPVDMAAPAVEEDEQRRSSDLGARNEALAQKAAKPQPLAAARAKAADAGPVWSVPSSWPIEVRTDAGTASYDLARRSIAEGRLPDPAAIRVGEILNAFDAGEAPAVEGCSTPFLPGPQYRLLRIHPGAARPIRVSFNPSMVARYRTIGSSSSVLYEIELQPGASRQAPVVGMLNLGSQGNAVLLSDLASSWDKASPSFRLAVLAAELAEILKGSPVDSSALHRLSKEIGRLPKSAKASELGEMVEGVARIRGER